MLKVQVCNTRVVLDQVEQVRQRRQHRSAVDGREFGPGPSDQEPLRQRL